MLCQVDKPAEFAESHNPIYTNELGMIAKIMNFGTRVAILVGKENTIMSNQEDKILERIERLFEYRTKYKIGSVAYCHIIKIINKLYQEYAKCK